MMGKSGVAIVPIATIIQPKRKISTIAVIRERLIAIETNERLTARKG